MPDFNLIAARAECVAEALRNLYRCNATPVVAIKALVEGRGLSLRDAKQALIDSPPWKVEATAAIELHEQIEKVLGRGSERV